MKPNHTRFVTAQGQLISRTNYPDYTTRTKAARLALSKGYTSLIETDAEGSKRYDQSQVLERVRREQEKKLKNLNN